MRTELEAEIAGGRVWGAVTVAALMDIAAHRDDFSAVLARCARGNAPDILAVLKAALRAGGTVKPAEAEGEARRLIEEGGLQACGEFCVRLLTHAFDKQDEADFQRAEEAPASPSEAET